MILIADSGSTKTHWVVLEGNNVKCEFFTRGINPFYQTEAEIMAEIEKEVLPELADLKVSQVFFYGAGCAFPEKKLLVSNAIGFYLRDVVIEVESDLLAAARALHGRSSGIACIMGTGSNSCLYDGKDIIENVSPLGFILGDEGSGAVLGKQLIADCLKNQLPKRLKEDLLAEYELTPAIVLENVYKKPFPNRFLARLSPFLKKNIEHPAILKIVMDSFNAFFVRNIKQYSNEGLTAGFVGSVAYHFEKQLREAAENNNVDIQNIVQSPMSGLIQYHSES